MSLYLIANGPRPTAAAQAPVTTGSVIKTMLQVKASGTKPYKIVEWGVSFDGSVVATPGKVELLETDGAATVTAHVAAGIVKLDGEALLCGDPTTNLFPVGTTSTGYTSTGEGTHTAIREFDIQHISPLNQYIKQFPLGREPVVQIGQFGIIRVTFAAAINCYAYIIAEI